MHCSVPGRATATCRQGTVRGTQQSSGLAAIARRIEFRVLVIDANVPLKIDGIGSGLVLLIGFLLSKASTRERYRCDERDQDRSSFF